ncbi:MAG: hypothetical protein LC803_10575 [Acidobacteria bacterium]|nr:hypothetical protein [Acidobacteriota bacterium]
MAHILGASSQKPRGDEPLDDREGNKHTNLIPLCPTHHTIINDQLRTYSVIVLRQMKANHRRLPFSTSIDKNAAYPEAFSTSQEEKIPPLDCK